MNDSASRTVNAAGKKQIRSPAALALAVVMGLTLLLPGAAALATPGTPIQGTEIGLEGDPGSVKVSAKTDENGAFNFTKLPAGKYKLTLPGLSPQSVTVGEKGTISGVLSREPNGTASITFNGKVGVVLDLPNGKVKAQVTALQTAIAIAKGEEPPPDNVLPSAPVNTSRSNKKAGIAKGEEPPPDDVLPGAPINTSRSNKKAGIAKAGEEPLPDDLPGAPVSTTRSNKKAGIAKAEEPPPDELPGAPVNTTRSNKKAGIAKAEEPLPDDLSGKAAPKKAADTTPTPPPPREVEWQPYYSGTAPPPPPTGGDVKPGISDQGAAGNLSKYSTAPPPKDGGSKAAESPVSFGSGNAGFGGTGHVMGGGGMAPPGAGMGGAGGPGPMGPGAGGPMGGSPGGAMRP